LVLSPPGLINLGFKTEGRLAAVLITPSLAVPNWSVIYINTAPSASCSGRGENRGDGVFCLNSDAVIGGRQGPWALNQEWKELSSQAAESGLANDLNLKKGKIPGNLRSLLLKRNSFPLESDTNSPEFLCSLIG
jgi:hypothetical protein